MQKWGKPSAHSGPLHLHKNVFLLISTKVEILHKLIHDSDKRILSKQSKHHWWIVEYGAELSFVSLFCWGFYYTVLFSDLIPYEVPKDERR